MFEKEAQEWVKAHTKIENKESYVELKGPSAIESFEAGAEFGYNKCKEELNQKGLALQSDMDKTIEQNIALKKELNNVKEWHYAKDELPPLNTNVLVIHKWHRTPEVGKRITVFPNCSNWVWAMCCDRYRYTSDDKNVIAWKEIVLPEQEG